MPRTDPRGGVALSLLLLLCACSPQLIIGVEHNVELAAATVDPFTGELRQAGAQRGHPWYGRSPPGAAVTFENTIDFPGALTAAVALPDGGWATAGHITQASGVRAAWVRALDSSDQERWTRILEGPPGKSWETRALAVDPAGNLLTGGLELSAGTSDEGWIASLALSDGAVRWKHALATDLQQQARGFRVHGIASIGSSLQRVFAVGDRLQSNGAVVAELLHFTVDGQLYDSLPLTPTPALARGVFLDSPNLLTACLAIDGEISVRHSDWLAATERRSLRLRVEGAQLELAGCTAASDGEILVSATAVYPDGRRVPYLAKTDRTASTVRFERTLATALPTTVRGVAADTAGDGWALGHLDQPVRRWMGR
jgi:hypothetical protein